MRSYRVHHYQHPRGGRQVTVHRSSALAAFWQLMTWCLAAVWPLAVWHGFLGGFAEGAWLLILTFVGVVNHRYEHARERHTPNHSHP